MSTTVTLEAPHARYLTDATLPAAAKDAVTPVICGALWTATPGTDVEVMATDRYRVHRVREHAEVTGDPGSFIVPRDAMVWLWRNANYFHRRGRSLTNAPQVSLRFDPRDDHGTAAGAVTIEVREDKATESRALTFLSPLTKGNFPPLARLFKEAENAETAAPDRVKLGQFADADRMSKDAADTPAIKYTVGTGSKPGPMLLKFRSGEVLIQPMASFR